MQYVDSKLFEISGKFERRWAAATLGGYTSFEPIARNLSAVIDVIWVSGTPALQIPLLLTIALSVPQYFSALPFAPRALFPLLRKLDLAFASLVRETNVETGERLPGFDMGASRNFFTVTQKVRLRGLVEETRLAVTKLAAKERVNGGEMEEIEDDEDGMVTEAETEDENVLSETESHFGVSDADEDVRGFGDWDVEISRVYEKTLVDLQTGLDEAPGH